MKYTKEQIFRIWRGLLKENLDDWLDQDKVDRHGHPKGKKWPAGFNPKGKNNLDDFLDGLDYERDKGIRTRASGDEMGTSQEMGQEPDESKKIVLEYASSGAKTVHFNGTFGDFPDNFAVVVFKASAKVYVVGYFGDADERSGTEYDVRVDEQLELDESLNDFFAKHLPECEFVSVDKHTASLLSMSFENLFAQ